MSPEKDGTSACTVNSVPEIMMNGGCNTNPANSGCKYENSTIYTSDGVTFAELPPMPIGMTSHCMVALDNDDLFVTGGAVPKDSGGSQYNDKSFLYHSDTMVWEELQGLPTPRGSLMCGLVHNINDEQDIIVVGGHGSEILDFNTTDLVEIYNIQSGQWRTG